MDKDRYQPITSSREPNPLRPYHRPATIDLPTSSPAQAPHSLPRPRAPASTYSSSARDLLPELDLDFKASAGEAWTNTRRLFGALLYRYMSVLLAQPFDVARLVLQVSQPPSSVVDSAATGGRKRRVDPRRRPDGYQSNGSRSRRAPESYDTYQSDAVDEEIVEVTDEDDDDDEADNEMPDYFTSTAPSSRSRSPRKRQRTPPSISLSPTPTPRDRHAQDDNSSPQTHALNLKRPESLTHALAQLYNTSGAIGCWRASNTTFLYFILLRSTDSFLRSLLLALLGLPDIPGPADNGLGPALGVRGGLGFSGLDLADSPNPFGSLVVVGLSSCLTGLLLAPLDLVRTKLILTPLSQGPRGLLQNLKRLPSLLPSRETIVPTLLSSTIPQVFSAATPLLLRRNFRSRLSPDTTPALWSMAAFATCLVDLFIRLPLETLTRRAQVATLKRMQPDLPLIVQPGEYKGVWGTVYSILYLEGETKRAKDLKTGLVRMRRGQGVSGLIRGWRVGFWGLVGVWGAGALGPAEAPGGGRRRF